MAFNVHVIECNVVPFEAPTAVGQHWVNTDTGGQWLSVGTNSVADWIEVGGETTIIKNIAAGGSIDLDIMPMGSLCVVKYIVCVASVAEGKWRSFEMLAGKKTASTLEDNLYAQIGSLIDVDFNFDVAGADAKLIGTNNESFPVDIKIHRTLL